MSEHSLVTLERNLTQVPERLLLPFNSLLRLNVASMGPFHTVISTHAATIPTAKLLRPAWRPWRAVRARQRLLLDRLRPWPCFRRSLLETILLRLWTSTGEQPFNCGKSWSAGDSRSALWT